MTPKVLAPIGIGAVSVVAIRAASGCDCLDELNVKGTLRVPYPVRPDVAPDRPEVSKQGPLHKTAFALNLDFRSS